MSKYLTIDELNIDNQDLLVQTLLHDVLFQGRLGLPGLEVESHDVAVHLYGIQDKLRPETAEVIVRRQFVGGAANDIGFKRQASGNFAPIISEFDDGYSKYGEAVWGTEVRPGHVRERLSAGLEGAPAGWHNRNDVFTYGRNLNHGRDSEGIDRQEGQCSSRPGRFPRVDRLLRAGG
jgi:hypothetical protein